MFDISFLAFIVLALTLTHITIISVTVFLHRNQAHKSVQISQPVTHFFRFWLWLTTGTITKEWVAIHRKHHAKVETDEDPHSPIIYGIYRVLFGGYFLYRRESLNQKTLEQYGMGTPNDYLEQNLYTKRNTWGILLLLLLEIKLFGWSGFGLWFVQMLWIPLWAAGVINGLGHWWGYRNTTTPDTSTNLMPWGIIVGGEELHNNHHAFPSSSKMSYKPWEFDIGWMYIKILEFARLAKPKYQHIPNREKLSFLEQKRAILQQFYTKVSLPTFKMEKQWFKSTTLKHHLKTFKKQIRYPHQIWESSLSENIKRKNRKNIKIQSLLQAKKTLEQLVEDTKIKPQELEIKLKKWCLEAEKSSLKPLQIFAKELRLSVETVKN